MSCIVSDVTEAQILLSQILYNSENAVFLGGAGVSVASGIPDFRSTDGLYRQKWNYPPESVLSHTFFMEHTEEFFRFYREKMLILDVQPNTTHKTLARLEEQGIVSCVITQNIDGLHQKAGSCEVLELHGSIHSNTCMSCGASVVPEDLGAGVPHCKLCGGIIKPDVVLYEEPLDFDVLVAAQMALEEADTLVVGGTSLSVWPAAGLIDYFGGKNLVICNLQSTPQDSRADLILKVPIEQAFDFD